jgi:hypothetical protein
MLQTFFVNPADFTRISLLLSICLSVYLQEEEEEEEVVVVVMSLSAKGGVAIYCLQHWGTHQVGASCKLLLQRFLFFLFLLLYEP